MKKPLFLALLGALALSACSRSVTPTPPAAENSVAPFLDTNKVARAMGGTLEWNKMEGVAYDAGSRTLYIAVSVISKDMSDAAGDLRLLDNKCGGIFAARLGANLVATKVTPILLGKPLASGECDTAAISEPDNLFLDGRGRLWIGEDTDHHENNMLWAYDLGARSLARFATVPLGAEVTGLRVSAQGDVFMNVQHPAKDNLAPYNVGTVGVVTGFNANSGTFAELSVPQGDDQKVVKVAAGSYTVLAQSGGDTTAGGAKVGETLNAGGSASLCNNPDGNMLVTQGENAGVLYSNFECRPGGVLRQDLKRESGVWKVAASRMVDFRSVRGTWNNCNASVTPWNTGLTSEEYPTETDADWAKAEPTMTKYLGQKANPYDYGYLSELTPGGEGTDIQKHYAMGRNSYEMGLVLPDRKTVYFGDDGAGRGMYRFVADAAGKLNAGTLYVARLTQVDDAASADGQSLNVTWVRLGHGTDAEIGAAIRRLDR